MCLNCWKYLMISKCLSPYPWEINFDRFAFIPRRLECTLNPYINVCSVWQSVILQHVLKQVWTIIFTSFCVADWKKKNFIDRFVQSVVSHGPSLIPLTRNEHGDGEESILNFLNPRREGNMGMNYFRNKLQVNIALLQVYSRAVL